MKNVLKSQTYKMGAMYEFISLTKGEGVET